MKRIAVLLFSVLFLFGATACSGSGDGTDIPSSEPLTDTSSRPTDSEPSKTSMTADEILAASEHYVGLCDQKNGRVIICDLAEKDWTDDNAVIWEYQIGDIQKESQKWIAGLKFRTSEYYGGDVMLYCAPAAVDKHAYIVSLQTKQVLLETGAAGVNPHSVELLPNGCLVVGSSNDGTLLLYPAGKSEPAQVLELIGTDSGKPDVHGVLWDPEYDCLWVAGGSRLRSFLVSGTADAPKLHLNAEYVAPSDGIHDLAPIYGDKDSLLITTSGGIIRFDKKTEKFNYSYSGSSVGKNYEYAPGCGIFEDGVLAFTAITDDTKVYQTWDTNVVQVYVPLGEVRGKYLTRKAPNDAYYKLRIFNTDYQ